jgi:hypothetical protein
VSSTPTIPRSLFAMHLMLIGAATLL